MKTPSFSQDFKTMNGKGVKVTQVNSQVLRVSVFQMKNGKFTTPRLECYYLPVSFIPKISIYESPREVIKLAKNNHVSITFKADDPDIYRSEVAYPLVDDDLDDIPF